MTNYELISSCGLLGDGICSTCKNRAECDKFIAAYVRPPDLIYRYGFRDGTSVTKEFLAKDVGT